MTSTDYRRHTNYLDYLHGYFGRTQTRFIKYGIDRVILEMKMSCLNTFYKLIPVKIDLAVTIQSQ